MTPEQTLEKVRAHVRVERLIAAAWHSIAEENNWRYDVFLTTCSYGTLALRQYFHLKGV